MKMRSCLIAGLLAALVLSTGVSTARAEVVSFDVFKNISSVDTSGLNITADLYQVGGLAYLTVVNNSTYPTANITKIYLENSLTNYLSGGTVVSQVGTAEFEPMPAPKNIAAGGNIGFVSGETLKANGEANFIGPGESVSLEFGLAGASSVEDVLNNIANEEARIALRVVGVGGHGQVSLGSHGSAAPAPPALLLGLLTAAGMGVTYLKRRAVA